MTVEAPTKPTVVTDADSGKDITVYGAGDYITKNGHLYFILDYRPGGFVIENCDTLYSHPVDFNFLKPDDSVKWIAKDVNYSKTLRRKGVNTQEC